MSNSLKTRLTFGSLLIFLASLWSLSFYASQTLRKDMERLLGEQQYSTVSLVANEVDHELKERIGWLKETASLAEELMQESTAATQLFLDRRINLLAQFNGGAFITDIQGTAVAEVPLSAKRIGINFMDRDYLVGALKEGKATIGRPVVGRTSKTPVIVLSVPLRDKHGEILGALAGVVNMAQPNFLDRITQNHYGRTGGFFLISPQHRMIATATDKRRVMEALPNPGVSPLIDRFIEGYEGSGVIVGTDGIEILTSAKRVPVVDWFVSGSLPAEEAFEPIREMQQRMLLATIVLTLVAGILSWWMLKNQLSPLLVAARALATPADADQPRQPLEVIRQDEIGLLIGGFNRLLDALGQRELLFKQVLDTSTVAIFLVDKTGHITQANQRMAEMFACPVNTLIGSDCGALLPPEQRGDISQLLRVDTTESDYAVDTDRVFYRSDQTCFWGHLTARRFVDARGGESGLVGVIADITVRKAAEEKNQLAASVFLHAREGITITAADGTIIDVNDAFTRITGYSREEALGKNPKIIKSDHHQPEFYAAMWRDLIEKGYWNGEIWNRRKNGELYPELLTISAVRDAHDSALHYVALFTDITPIKEHEEQLKHMAHFDLLTTLPNRVLLGDRLHQAMTQTLRRKQLLAVAYLDLDGFKTINDTYGHKTGDQLLVALAGRMRDALREGDTLARLGGDEFVAVLIDLTDVSASLPMLNRLLNAAAQPVHIGELELQVSASLGITFYPQKEEVDADQLLRQADQAMYQAKLAGKNRYQIFDADQDRSLRGHHESLEHIRRALVENEFVLYYQPKVNLRTGQVVGAEALIRWQHPDKGLLPPGVFLPIIENHALALDVGEWVIHTATRQIESWHAAGLNIPVSVNVGARQLQHGDFVERLQTILSKHPALQPGDLTLEVLETSALEDLAGVSEIIEKCKELGVLFSLDDFGTGYSSLSYLKRLSVNQLKIDQSFVRDMLEDPDDLTILEGVISLAGAFRREVIAEGVETAAHGEMLLLLGCDLAQGYGIARPMPAADLPAWAASWRPDPRWKTLLPVSKDDLPLLFALTEHRAWVLGIEKTLQEGADLPSVHSIHHCRFGTWLRGEGANRHDHHPDFPEIKRLHEELHSLAESLAEKKHQDNQEQTIETGTQRLQALSEVLLVRLKALIAKQ